MYFFYPFLEQFKVWYMSTYLPYLQNKQNTHSHLLLDWVYLYSDEKCFITSKNKQNPTWAQNYYKQNIISTIKNTLK